MEKTYTFFELLSLPGGWWFAAGTVLWLVGTVCMCRALWLARFGA